MITEEVLDNIISSLEEKPFEMEEFYERMSDMYPVSVGWLTNRLFALYRNDPVDAHRRQRLEGA